MFVTILGYALGQHNILVPLAETTLNDEKRDTFHPIQSGINDLQRGNVISKCDQ